MDHHSPEEAEAGGNRWASGSPAKQLVSSRLVRDSASSPKAEKLENTGGWPLAYPHVCTNTHTHMGTTGVMVTHFQYHSCLTPWYVLHSLWTMLFLGLLTLWQRACIVFDLLCEELPCSFLLVTPKICCINISRLLCHCTCNHIIINVCFFTWLWVCWRPVCAFSTTVMQN